MEKIPSVREGIVLKHTALKCKRLISHLLHLRHTDLRCGYLGALVMLLFTVMIRLLSGSPYYVYHMLKGSEVLPPLATLTFTNLLLTTAMGFACGLVLSCPRRNRRCLKYQGGMLFVLHSVFWFSCYPLIFQGCLLVPALFSLVLAWLLCLGCIALFFRVHPLAGGIAAIFLFWMTYLLLSLVGCILVM